MNIIAARPGVGKTSFITTIALVAAQRFLRQVLFFNLQLTNSQLWNRIVALNSRIEPKRLLMNDLTQEEEALHQMSAKKLGDMPLILRDAPLLFIDQVVAECQRYSLENQLGLVIIDGVEHLERFSTTNQSSSARWLKFLAKTFNVPVWATLPVGNQVDKRHLKRPILTDIEDDWSAIADTIITIYRDDYYYSETERPNMAEVSVLKNRSGPLGTIDLFWHGKLTTFRNLHRQEIEL